MSKSQEAGKELENNVENIYLILLKNEHLKNFKIIKNHKEKAKSGALHEFDVFYEVEIAGVSHKVAIECKNYNKNVEKEKLDAFSKKLDGCNIKTGFMIAANGYQKGAKREAKFYGIELITTEDLPNIYPLTLNHVKWLLPDENTYGDPYWIIMEVTEDGKNKGICYSPSEKIALYMSRSNPHGETTLDGAIALFISKKSAERALEADGAKDCAVFGVSRQHLIALCDTAEDFNRPFAIALDFGPGKDGRICMLEQSYDQILDNFGM
ncbi:hypothetical protein MSSAC_0998 [Methanosarcina siciliae C2J]|uniref:Restriction endonuclease type IV Mrr domain-containing protein n=1 Tax=Methanosarcina siciliae C2J TaxID=1434118 RepID=A0A0E3PLD0_9EURY|nr:restriction endonuclease [Methanosarcina siciliae]AKB35588.1 hypothetical protein MSSAC_0998 [Methanosarcina siciliae C2J]